MEYITEPAKTLPVRMECDVLVAGGGTAGVAAAICAARTGAQVVLIEALPVLGGTLGGGGIGVNNIFSSYVSDDVPVRRVVKGFTEDFIERLKIEGGISDFVRMDAKTEFHRMPGKYYFDHEVIKPVLAQMMKDAGVQVLLHTFFSDAVVVDGQVQFAIIESKAGREAIMAKTYIDCTGDGDLAIRAGAGWTNIIDTYTGENAGFVFGIGGADLSFIYKRAKTCGAIYEPYSGHDGNGGPKDGTLHLGIVPMVIPEWAESFKELNIVMLNFYSMHSGDITYVHSISKGKIDPTDPVLISKAEMDMRILALKLTNLLREKVPGFENSFMSWQATQVGIRGSRIVKCDYSLTLEDITNSARFEDEIGIFGYHDYAPRDERCRMKNQGFYGLPYRMLLPGKTKNVWAAGRILSEDFYAQMSTRNTVCCMEQGQAAGIAAALCAEKGINSRDLDYADIRAALEAQNVYFAT